MLKSKIVKRSIVVLFSIGIFLILGIGYNLNFSKERYSVNLNLMFNLNTNYHWNFISQRYENIINLYNTKEKENELISNALNDAGVSGDTKNITIDPSVISRQINITYKAENQENGINVVEAIGNSIIKANENYIPTKMVYLKKNVTITEGKIRLNKNLNIFIFVICGLSVGLGIIMFTEAKCLSRKK